MKRALAFILAISLSPTAMAATLIVPNQYGNIQLAIDASSDGDTVLVSPGYYMYVLGFRIIGKSIHVVSEKGPDVTTIANYAEPPSGETGSYAFYIESVPGPCTISGFKMEGHRPGDMAMNNFTIKIWNSNVRITGNVFVHNYQHSVLDIEGSSSPLIEYNVFTINTATSIIIRDGSSPTIERNTFSANPWHEQIWIMGDNSHPVIRCNVIVNGNMDGPYSYSYGVKASTPAENIVFECNDVWNNATANYSGTLPDQTGINGNISEDPLFCGIPGSGNFYLQSNSPCAEENAPAFCSGQYMGCFPVLCTVGTKEESWGSIKSRFGEGKK
jgi:parallel beta-helix repeat protein